MGVILISASSLSGNSGTQGELGEVTVAISVLLLAVGFVYRPAWGRERSRAWSRCVRAQDRAASAQHTAAAS